MQFSTLLIFAMSVPLCLTQGSEHTFKSHCDGFATHRSTYKPQDPVIKFAHYLTAGTTLNLTAEGLNETCANLFPAPPLPASICRVTMEVATSNASSIRMEVWLPESWSGRIAMTGNGGLAGCIQYSDVAYATSYGFAAIGTNNGHDGTSGGAFFHQPEVLKDFAGRAIEVGTKVGKAIADEFYGRNHDSSYFFGCSTGGRQGFKAAQEYPDLFDGIVAGAPAMPFNSILAWAGLALQALTDPLSGASIVGPDQWLAIQEEVLHQCDHIDGAVDGILEDTRKCTPDLTRVLCSNSNRSGCLTQYQLSAVEKVFSPFTLNETLQHPGPSHGYEVSLDETLNGPLFTAWLQEWWSYVVYEDLAWDRRNFSIHDAKRAIEQNPFDIQTYNPDLSAFRDRGGKLLHWHGQADQYLPVGGSDHYYDLVTKTMNSTSAQLDDFYRYFRISGMQHCYGGPGAYLLGQLGGLAASSNPEDNMLMRIVEWVENGSAPEFVRGTALLNETDPSQGIAFTRKHCKHPKVNLYNGTGNGKDEAGWHCTEF